MTGLLLRKPIELRCADTSQCIDVQVTEFYKQTNAQSSDFLEQNGSIVLTRKASVGLALSLMKVSLKRFKDTIEQI